jgi:hypothetical protein
MTVGKLIIGHEATAAQARMGRAFTIAAAWEIATYAVPLSN